MSVLKDNYNRIMSEVEEKITNPEDLEFVKKKMSELSLMFMDVIDAYTDATEERIKKIEDKQKQIEVKFEEVENFFDEIESEIYEEMEETNMDDEEGYDFEIVCPYCDYVFVADINGKNEVSCPECKNAIELDWNEDSEENGCQGGHCKACPGCQGGCSNDDKEQDNEDNNEDDM